MLQINMDHELVSNYILITDHPSTQHAIFPLSTIQSVTVSQNPIHINVSFHMTSYFLGPRTLKQFLILPPGLEEISEV